MLINCPRCGFQQPKDKYCAQCGVDIDNFKPTSTPFFQKILKNHLLLTSLIVVVVAGVSFTVYQGVPQNLERRVGLLRANVQINPSGAPTEETTASSMANESLAADLAESSEASPSEMPPTSVDAFKVTPPNEVAAAAEGTEKEERSLAKVSGQHLTVYYAEVGRTSLSSAYAASRDTGQFMSFNEYSAGILPGLEAHLKKDDVLILHKEERVIESAKTLQWFYGLKDRVDPSVEIGLTTFFEISDIENTNLRGNLEIQRTWKEPNTATAAFEIQRKSFPAIFEIGAGTGFFMSGVMPHRSNLENENELIAIDIYKILRSPRFKTGESEFVIFVEFKKDN